MDDSPDDEGNPVTRACKPYDNIPKPYANEKAARAANAGALPPDLSLICWAREGEENYLYSVRIFLTIYFIKDIINNIYLK